MNRLFVSPFPNNVDKTKHTEDFIPKVKYYNVMMDGQTLKNDLRTYDNIEKIEVGKGDDYRTGFLIDFTYFKEALHADQKATHQNCFAGNLQPCS